MAKRRMEVILYVIDFLAFIVFVEWFSLLPFCILDSLILHVPFFTFLALFINSFTGLQRS